MLAQPQRTEQRDLQGRMRALRARDLQLWSLGLLVLLVPATGVISLALPHIMWRGRACGWRRPTCRNWCSACWP